MKYRADHVGSFLRPPDLLEARVKRPGSPQLRDLEDRHIMRLLKKQKELGFEIFTDGELRRRNFMSSFTDSVEGFDRGAHVAREWDRSTEKPKVADVLGIVTRRLKYVRSATADELLFLRARSPGDVKVVLPSPTQFPAISFQRGVSDRVYKDHSALLWDIVDLMKKEIAEVSCKEVQYIQIDAPRYSYYLDPKWRSWIKEEMRQDPEAALDEAIRADNACFRAARRPGVTLAIHLCRGNNRSHWYAQGGYDAIAEKLFGTLEVDRFVLEYDDERAGTFEPLRLVPKDKIVVLGLVTTKKAALEKPEDIARRVEEAAQYFPIERLALSPQCGFASTMEGNFLTEDEQWAKMGLVADSARKLWA